MTQTAISRVRLKVSPQVAGIVTPGTPRDTQLEAARGAVPLSPGDQLTALFFLCNSRDPEIKRTAVQTLRDLPEQALLPVFQDPGLDPQLITLLVRARLSCSVLMCEIIAHPSTPDQVLLHLAAKAELPVLHEILETLEQLEPRTAIVSAMLTNPHADSALTAQLAGLSPDYPAASGPEPDGGESPDPDPDPVDSGPSQDASAEAEAEDVETVDNVDVARMMAEAEKEGASKYQIALNLRVAEKIKIALTGDKEWRSIMIKESNKLVQGAVLKNPRISDGEVVMIAKNKTASDDLIRQILLNKDWMKLYDIKKALAIHPKTPAPKAIRLVTMLNTKDVKDLMRSKGVATVVAISARKEFENRQKRIGG